MDGHFWKIFSNTFLIFSDFMDRISGLKK